MIDLHGSRGLAGAMRRVAIGAFAVVFVTLFASPAAFADEGSLMLRVRALTLIPANQSTAIPALGVPPNAITLNSKTFPEIDVSYFANPHWAAELILTYPQKETVSLSGETIGTFNALPPTLTLQYHLSPNADVQPYIGAGVNYTLIYPASIHVPGVGALTLQHSSFGGAFQAGADFRIAPREFVNLDVKYVGLASKIYAAGNQVSTATVDPWLFGVGYGARL